MREPETPQRGKDFILGFVPSLIIAGIAVAMLVANLFQPVIWAGAGLAAATVIAFVRLRPFIAIGILVVLLATPLLLVGSCFALFAFNQ